MGKVGNVPLITAHTNKRVLSFSSVVSLYHITALFVSQNKAMIVDLCLTQSPPRSISSRFVQDADLERAISVQTKMIQKIIYHHSLETRLALNSKFV